MQILLLRLFVLAILSHPFALHAYDGFRDHPTVEQIYDRLGKVVEGQKPNNPFKISWSEIGKTVQNRRILGFKLHSKSGADSTFNGGPILLPEDPLFKRKLKVLLIANMHGDEITGREVMVRFLEEARQMIDQGNNELTDLLQNISVYVVPTLNPDGAEAVERYNANGADLNRSFPSSFDFASLPGQPVDQREVARKYFAELQKRAGREPEVRAIMQLYRQMQSFDLSANYHGGAEVVSLPFDERPDPYIHNELMEELAKIYIRDSEGYMKNHEFPSGFTNGYAWYQVIGGLQDWSIDVMQSPHITIELSNQKWPDYDMMDEYYRLNRKAIFSYIKYVRKFVLKTSPARICIRAAVVTN